MSFELVGVMELSEIEERVAEYQLWCLEKALGMADESMCTIYMRGSEEIEYAQKLANRIHKT